MAGTILSKTQAAKAFPLMLPALALQHLTICCSTAVAPAPGQAATVAAGA
jgi:hypothetical protein